MDWHTQSETAKAVGVCHTEDECDLGYAELDSKKKQAAIEFLRGELKEPMPEIKKAIADDPDHWNVPYHLGWGMAVRNLLRANGMGEEYFDVDNLDCIYQRLIGDAATE